MEPLSQFKGKIALVAGASRGIGRAVSLSLAAKGCRILAVARTETDLQKLLLELPGEGHHIITCDLTTADGIDNLYLHCKEKGFPDIVIANLNFRFPQEKLGSHSLSIQGDDLLKNIDYLTKIIPDTIEHQKRNLFGRWIGIGTIVVKMGGPGQFRYSASKQILASMMKTIAVEYGYCNITANMVLPGFIDTDATRENYAPEVFNHLASMNLMKRAGSAQEIAHAVTFLADPLASFITGIEIPVCGGYDLSWALSKHD
jgi:NAD(P)-dependent dehydrogenase (short-subunit alcohol dehydrogenase family)